MIIVRQIKMGGCLLLGIGCLWGPAYGEDSFAGIPPWRVGQWASYQIETHRGERRSLDLAIVGYLRIQGQDYFWCELKGEEGGRSVLVRQLVSGDRRSFRDALVQREGQAAPLSLRKGSRVSLSGGEGWHMVLQWLPTGMPQSEQLLVFAGEFSAQRYELHRERFWFAPGVPITGLVKAETSRLGKITLMAYGLAGAESAIKGEPIVIQTPRLQGIGR